MFNITFENFNYAVIIILVVLERSDQIVGSTDLESDTEISFEQFANENETFNNDSRINGGEIVKRVVPYQISMQMQRRGQWRHFCSGSIISANHVITAAHCIDKIKNIKEISVVAGTLKWNAVGGSTGGDRHMLVGKHVHSNFALEPNIINDIAIVKVTPPFNLRRHSIATIGLGGSNHIGDKVVVRVTGWGSTAPTVSSTKDLPTQLQSLDYYTISNEICGRRGFKVTSSELCALAPKGKGACMGDSGGPLVTLNGIPQLVGIVSYGSSQCAQGRPDVYTRISSFLPYINKVMAKELP